MLTLPNDLRVIVQPDDSSRVVALDVLVRFGAEHEARPTAGARYFLQNAMLRGTRDRDADEIAEAVAERGATLNMSVSDDFVEFYATGRTNAWEFLLELVAEVLMRPKLDDRDIEAVRTDLLGMVQRRHDDAGAWSYDLFREALFINKQSEPIAYGVSPVGYDDSLRRITRASLRDFHRQYYVPNNTVICLVGDVKPAEVKARASELFRNFAKRAVPLTPAPEFASAKGRSVVKERKGEMTWLVFGYPAPPVTLDDYVPARVANAILGEGMASRLFKKVREEKQLAYELTNYCPPRALLGDISTYAAIRALKDERGRVADLRLDETKDAIAEEYERLTKEPVTEAELRRAKNYLVGTYAIAHERTRQKAWHLGRFECLGVGYEFDRRFPELVKRVTAADVQKVASSYFKDAVVAVVMPQAVP